MLKAVEPATRVAMAVVTDRPIDEAAVIAAVDDARAGATVTFAGVVRNHDGGRAVEAIEYVGHPSAAEVIVEVVSAVAASLNPEQVHAVAVAHRVGHLPVGDVAMVVAVSSSHRAEAFAAAAELVDRVKEALPVWKKQLFSDGSHEWSNCP